MKNKKLLLGISLIVITLSSCKKYEDGPLISLRSREERVANNWRIEKAMDNGNDITSDIDNYHVSFTKGGEATLTAKYNFLGVTYTFSTHGTWSFENKDEKIKVDYEDDNADATYLILRLKEKELWVREEGNDLEIHLVPN
ncbi:MAG: hypothetical protein ABI723_25750 [Bacteroidia bacterium]